MALNLLTSWLTASFSRTLPHVASGLLFGSVVRRLCKEMGFLSYCISNTILSSFSHGCSGNY